MAVNAFIALVWRIKLSEILAMASAPVGAAFTFITLVTGSIWGKPMWGTWWTWDARLTSELVLLFLYLGVIGLYHAIDDRRQAARAASFLALIGIVNVPIVHFSVNWWNTLHQGSTVRLLGPSKITRRHGVAAADDGARDAHLVFREPVRAHARRPARARRRQGLGARCRARRCAGDDTVTAHG